MEKRTSSSDSLSQMLTFHDSNDAEFDIVMVHGLAGHPLHTWSCNGICWPRDFLHRYLRSPVRILSFGYDAGKFKDHANLDIEDAALLLIDRLQEARSTAKEKMRPLIFITHSLGGIVVKKALIIINNKPFLADMIKRLAGIIFLGTPHRGSSLAAFAERLFSFHQIIKIGVLPHKLIRSLKENSPELVSIADDFRQIAQQRSLLIASFYELLPLKGGLICFKDIVVVYKESAMLDIPCEECVALPLNHHDICKFREPDDDFGHVLRQLNRFIECCPTESSARVFLPWETTQYFTGRRSHLQQIHEALSGPGRRIVVVHGDGGMGKTEVALKYAREAEQRYDFVLFVDSTSVETFAADLIDLHHKIGLPREDGREVESMKRFLQREKGWLLVLDNDDDYLGLDQIAFPKMDHGHIIITCRGREYNGDPRVSKSIRLGPFSLKDAKDLLFSRANASLEQRALYDAHANSVIKRMGSQPLVLDSAGAYMSNSPNGLKEYLKFLKGKRFPRHVLSYRPKSSRYQKSVESVLQITLNEIKKNHDAYILLKLLVWLDRTKTTVGFLKRAVSPQTFWGNDGEPVMRYPRESYVPEDIIELINGPDFEFALAELKSYALIANDEKTEEDGASYPGTIVLHPLTYNYVRETLTADELIESAGRALSLMVHAHPEVQGGLGQSGQSTQEIKPQLLQCNLNRIYLEERGINWARALQATKAAGNPSFAERTAAMLFEAIRGYGEGRDEVDHMLLNWLKELLGNSTSIELQTRLWCTRLPLEFYSRGKFTEGCEATATFLQSIKSATETQTPTKAENAQLGFLRHLSVEYLVREQGLSNREVWEKRAAYIDEWQPLDRGNPSTLEKYAMGMGVRMRGKLAKDFGLFKEAYYSLKLFTERYAKLQSREEGWAIGDFGQVVLELEDRTEDGREILQDLITNGTNFGKQRTFPPEARPCEIVSFICSQAIEDRMFERGYITPEDRENVRENDTMFLEINRAVSVLREGRLRPERYTDAKKLLLGLRARYEKTRSEGPLWHDDQIREFSVIAYLAQIAHLQGEWEEAQLQWTQAIDYGKSLIDEWDNDHFYIQVAECSLADAQLSVGPTASTTSSLREKIRRLDEERVTWMLGLGTFWFDYVKESIEPKLKLEESRLKEDKKNERVKKRAVIMEIEVEEKS